VEGRVEISEVAQLVTWSFRVNQAKGHVVEGSIVIVVVGEPLGVAAAGRVVWWWW
jgi:hypothetical protein